MSASITTHILDTSLGRPATGVKVELSRGAGSQVLATGVTDDDGRVAVWSDSFELEAGDYTLSFSVEAYFTSRDEASFYSSVQINFKVDSIDEHYQVPLLLNPFGYSTYRGS